MAYNAPEGTADMLPAAARLWRSTVDSAAKLFGTYGYEPIYTPLFEITDVFTHGIGEATDVVGKEMFVVRSGENYKRALAEGDDSKLKSKQKLSLRPEGTAGVVRAVVQHNLVEQGAAPAKLFYAGPMFRAERPQKGRLRQFHQIGAECLGSTEPTADAEMIIMLMRFFEIDGGEIRIDGVPTRDMRREDVHSLFCMVLQDTWLFEGTIRENLVYCDEGVDDEKVRRACRAVGLDHFIRSQPHGYDTVLNDQINLSQGQKQQMTIARAMIADKPMLILDEATSNVDTRTELKIQQAMDELMSGRTSFVIAHRLSTIKNADLILVMKEGDIIESGTHDELLAAGGFYADLYNSQFAE